MEDISVDITLKYITVYGLWLNSAHSMFPSSLLSPCHRGTRENAQAPRRQGEERRGEGERERGREWREVVKPTGLV